MQIEIINKHTCRRRHGIWIDRRTVLGNPFHITATCTREQSVEAYQQWLRRQWKAGGRVKEALVQLAQQYKRERELTLLCWCTPLACHGDVLADAITALIRQHLV